MGAPPQYLFVYGTLLDGQNEFGRYLQTHCSFYSAGKLRGKLYDIGEYPGAVADAGDGSFVYGSIYLLDDIKVLEKLDDYEGVGGQHPQPNEYVREMVDVEVEAGLLQCWVYIYNWPVERLEEIASGDYLAYIANVRKG